MLRTLTRDSSQLAWRAVLALLLLVISVLAWAPAAGPPGIAHTDKLHHLLAFASLALAASFAQRPSPAAYWRSGIGLLLYGALIELVQAQMPSRTASLWDLLANALGIAAGLWLAQRWRRLAAQAV